MYMGLSKKLCVVLFQQHILLFHKSLNVFGLSNKKLCNSEHLFNYIIIHLGIYCQKKCYICPKHIYISGFKIQKRHLFVIQNDLMYIGLCPKILNRVVAKTFSLVQ